MRVLSVNVGRVESRTVERHRVATAIGKRPVAGPVAVGPAGVAGDEQADRSLHGGASRAVYAYPAAHYPFWQTVRAQARVAGWDEPLPWGLLGENLTIEGLDERHLWIGDRLVLPDCVLAVSEPRLPCAKFGAALGFAQAVGLMVQSGFCGAFFAVVEPGSVCAGQTGRVEPGPREVGIRELFRARLGR